MVDEQMGVIKRVKMIGLACGILAVTEPNDTDQAIIILEDNTSIICEDKEIFYYLHHNGFQLRDVTDGHLKTIDTDYYLISSIEEGVLRTQLNLELVSKLRSVFNLEMSGQYVDFLKEHTNPTMKDEIMFCLRNDLNHHEFRQYAVSHIESLKSAGFQKAIKRYITCQRSNMNYSNLVNNNTYPDPSKSYVYVMFRNDTIGKRKMSFETFCKEVYYIGKGNYTRQNAHTSHISQILKNGMNGVVELKYLIATFEGISERGFNICVIAYEKDVDTLAIETALIGSDYYPNAVNYAIKQNSIMNIEEVDVEATAQHIYEQCCRQYLTYYF